MFSTARDRTARTPLWTVTGLAVAVLSLSVLLAPPAQAQNRGNAQAEQSQTVRARGGGRIAMPNVGRYVAETGEAFVLDRSGRHPLLRFDRREETWVLRPTPAPRGDVIYRNDAGQQVLRVTASGGMTVYTPRAPGGSPAAYSGGGASLSAPTLGPVQLFQLMARRSRLMSQALGKLIEVNLDGERSESLCVEALIVATDAVVRIARSPSARQHLRDLRSVTVLEGSRSNVSYVRGRLVVTVNPDQGMAGRPSSERVIRAIVPQS